MIKHIGQWCIVGLAGVGFAPQTHALENPQWDGFITYEQARVGNQYLPITPNAKPKYTTTATAVVKYTADLKNGGYVQFDVQNLYRTNRPTLSQVNQMFVATPHADNQIRMGRMVLSHGTAYGYEPLDFFHGQSPSGGLFKPQSHGVDGVAYERYLEAGDIRFLAVQNRGRYVRAMHTANPHRNKTKRTTVGVQGSFLFGDAEVFASAYQTQIPKLGQQNSAGAGVSYAPNDEAVLYTSFMHHNRINDYRQNQNTPNRNPAIRTRDMFTYGNVGNRTAYTAGVNYTLESQNLNIIAETSQRATGLSRAGFLALSEPLNNPQFGVPSATTPLLNHGMRRSTLIRLSPADGEYYPEFVVVRPQGGGSINRVLKTWTFADVFGDINGYDRGEFKLSYEFRNGGKRTWVGNLSARNTVRLGISIPLY